MRTIIESDPYVSLIQTQQWPQRGAWPCRWIGLATLWQPPFAAAYRRRFQLEQAATIRLHVTADERYEFFLDGVRVGRGSERGDEHNWFYETYDLPMKAGAHVLVARVWSLGGHAPYAQMSVRHGFLCAAEGAFIDVLGTGVAAWDAKKLDGYAFIPCGLAWGAGAKVDIHGEAFPWGFEQGGGDGWAPAVALHPGVNGFIKNEFAAIHHLKPATLPAMLEQAMPPGMIRHVEAVASLNTEAVAVRAANHLSSEAAGWQGLVNGGRLTIPPNTTRRAILDLNNYYCVYPSVTVSGGKGAVIRIQWAEALYEPGTGALSSGGEANARSKGNRDQIEGKEFIGVGDIFRPEGGRNRLFETLWWEPGRYVEIMVCTGAEALTLERLTLRETRYPFEPESKLACSDERWARLTPIAVRVIQMCSHETYFDCPYYEQLMYVGDTRLQVLTTFALSRDSRLPRKALRMFEASRFVDRGLTQSRYPSRVAQIIPPFSLWWTAMVHDYALWRGDPDFVRSLLPGVRTVLETYLQLRNRDGLVQAPAGWNFMDWVPEWTTTTNDVRNWGVPPDGEFGANGLINWLTILSLRLIADVEEWMGESELAARDRREAANLATSADRAFWDARRNLYAEDVKHQHFTEHTQCLALLSGCLDAGRQAKVAAALVADPALARTTIYFAHYLFEVLRLSGRMDVLFNRMELWFGLEAQGFKTTFEEPEPSRSDCHGWGAHPLYHYFATILGIRPIGMGFQTVRIQPQLGPLQQACGTLVHPQGDIIVELSRRNGRLAGTIELPAGISGQFVDGQTVRDLKPGWQRIG